MIKPIIGRLLDAWDHAPNDFCGSVREDVPQLAEALDELSTAAEHGAFARDVGELVLGLRIVRSLIHNLPRSATADRIDMICADALGEPRTP
jgi:hypothetical protein